MGKKRVRFSLPDEPLLDRIIRTQAELFKRRVARPTPLPRPPPRELYADPSPYVRMLGQGYCVLETVSPHVGYWGRD